MTPAQELEARVIAWVRGVLAGNRIEDDRVECKSDWPDREGRTARQLGGHANSSRSERIYWIIGLDEDAHQLRMPSAVDPAEWWAGVSKEVR